MEPEQKSKKRPASDAVHVTFAVPSFYVYDAPTDDDDEVNKETRYEMHACQGWDDDTLEDILTQEYLKQMGIEGPYDIVYKPDAAYSRKSVTLGNFTLGYLKQHFTDKAGDVVLILKPRSPIWYRCMRLTDEEVDALKRVVDRVFTQRVTKKQKTQ